MSGHAGSEEDFRVSSRRLLRVQEVLGRCLGLPAPRLEKVDWRIVVGIAVHGRPLGASGHLDFGADDLGKGLGLDWWAEERVVRGHAGLSDRLKQWEGHVRGLVDREVLVRLRDGALLGFWCCSAGADRGAESLRTPTGPTVCSAQSPASPPGHIAAAAVVANAAAAVVAPNVTNVSDVTFKRCDVATIKRSYVTSLAATASEVECREAVMGFVGESDYFRYWATGRSAHVFDVDRPALVKAYNYFVAGVASGEVKVKTNNGRALYAQFQFEREFLNRQRATMNK